MYMFIAFFLVFLTSSTNWPLIQRYASTKSEKDAKKMAYLVCVLLFVGPPLFFFPAMAAKVFLTNPIPDAELNGVYAILCREVLPVGMIGMVVAAMFSATMSSLAGNFNAVAMVMTNEVYAKIDRNATPARKMVAGILFRFISKRAGMTALVGGIVIGLVAFGCGAWYPPIRETIPMTWLTALSTLALLVVGTFVFPDKPEERTEVDAFFRKITSAQK